MAAEITGSVHMDVEIGTEHVCTDIGEITVPVHNGSVEMPEVRLQLAALFTELGAWLRDDPTAFGLAAPPVSPGVGESRSPG
ncbi:hypothetical protein [Streptomyces sp. NPDC091416]|uniref:hypothetical protein n=1 Tax=Streptomyces sp. NPDC091416 TaxID=3366003 RepID=UPI0038232D96